MCVDSSPDGLPQPLDFIEIYRVWYHKAGKFGRELNLAVLAIFHCNCQIKIRQISYIHNIMVSQYYRMEPPN